MRSNEEKYSILFETMAQGVVYQDKDGRIINANPAAERILGLSVSQMTGRTSTDTRWKTIHEDGSDFPGETHPAMVTLKTGKPNQQVMGVFNPVDGFHRWIIVNSIPQFRKGEKLPYQVITTFEDITDLKRAELALSESEERFRRALENIPDVVVIYGPDLRIRFINSATRRITGRPASYFIGKRDDEIWPPEVYNTYLPSLKEALETGGIRTVETWIFMPDTGQRNLKITCVPLTDEKGRVREILGISHDFTEHKHTEAILKKSETRYRELFDNILEGYAYCRMVFENGEPSDFIYLAVNNAFENLTGLKNVVGKKVTEVIPGIRQAEPELFAIYSRVCLTGKPEKFEYFVKALNMWFSVSVYSPEKEFFVAVFDVITERKKAEKEIAYISSIYSILSHANEAIVRIKDKSRLLDEICHIVVKDGLFRMAWIGFVAEDTSTVRPFCSAGTVNGYLDNIKISTADVPEGRGPTGSTIRTGKHFVCNDIQSNPAMAPWRAEALKRDYRSSAAFPIKTGGNVIGAFNIYASESHFFNESELRLLDQLSDDISYALEMIDLSAKIEEQNQLIRHVTDTVPNVIYIYDLVEHRNVYSNKGMTDLLGYTPKEVVEMGTAVFARLLHPEDADRVSAHHQMLSTAEPGKVLEIEYRMKDRNGAWHYLVSRDTPFIKNHDGTTKQILGVCQDISDRKKAEIELRENESRLKNLLDSIPTGIMLIRKNDQIIIDVNKAAMEIIGLPKDSIIGQSCHNFVCPAEIKCCPIVDLGQTVDRSERFLIRGNGSQLPILKTVIQITMNNEVYLLESFIDISEHKKMEAEKQKIYEQLLQAQKIESIGTLSGGIAHDFNNLLTTIKGFSELAMMKTDEKAPLYGELSQINTAAERASNLVRKLLLFSSKQPMNFIPLNLNHLVEELLKMLARLIGEDITIKTELFPDISTIRADAGNIEQVIVNLAVNARDAMPSGGTLLLKTENTYLNEAKNIMMPGTKPGDFVCLTIEDTGTGMTGEVLSHIYEPFFTTKEVGKGTGLGLSVVYGIVKQHNGTIHATSEPGKGTAFRIFFPAVSEKPIEEAKKPASLAELRGNGEIVLLVEDDNMVRNFATTVLEENGYVVVPAQNSAEAVFIFKKDPGKFNLIFSDVVLPDKNGVELVEELLSIKPDVSVLFNSGYSDQKLNAPLLKNPAMHFLHKPYTIIELLQTIKLIMKKT